jgi:hypothetical protein
MSPTKVLGLVTVTVAAAAAIGVNLASGQAPPQRSVLTFTATPTGGSGLDVGRKGPSVGDEFFEHGKLSGAASGRYHLITQLVAGDARRGTEHNHLSLTLPGGELETSGTHGLVSRFQMPVTGGTGDYEGARGVMAVSPGPKGSAERVTVTLDR